MSTELLISLVKKKPWLYDSAHKDYRDSVLAANTWQAIGATMQVPGEACKKRWKNVRDTYAKQKAVHSGGVKSQSASKYLTKWKHLDAMNAFMSNHVKRRNSFANAYGASAQTETQVQVQSLPPEQTQDTEIAPTQALDNGNDEAETNGYSLLTVYNNHNISDSSSGVAEPSPTISTGCRRRKRKASESGEAEALASISASLVSTDAAIVKSKDVYGHFADFVAEKLRTVPPDVADAAMLDVMAALLKATSKPKENVNAAEGP